MVSRAAGLRWQRNLRSILQPFAEFIHVSAIYMGLAVLTTLALSLILPSMRQQSRQVHEVVLAMFQADGMNDVAGPAEGYVHDWTLPSELPASPPDFAGSTDPGQGLTQDQGHPNEPSFSQALSDSLNDRAIPGVTRAQAQSLRSYLARKYRIAPGVAGALVRIAFSVAHEMGVDPQLVLAVIAIESRYNPFVESAVGAQGLMQIMTRVHIDKLNPTGGAASVFNPVVNIRVGTRILDDCIQRRKSVRGGLACYVGATGPGDGGYGSRVLAERRRIALASGIAPDD